MRDREVRDSGLLCMRERDREVSLMRAAAGCDQTVPHSLCGLLTTCSWGPSAELHNSLPFGCCVGRLGVRWEGAAVRMRGSKTDVARRGT
jgi:hypothetical protein